MREFITRNIGGRQVLLFFVAANVVFLVMIFITVPMVMQFSGGMKLFDMTRGGYDVAYANALLNRLGQQGRDTYLHFQLMVDMVYPFLSGSAYCLLIAYFLKQLGKLDGFLFYVCLLPLVSAVCDYGENFGIMIMLNRFPDNSEWLTHTTSLFTVTKGTIAMFYFVALAVLVVAAAIRKVRTRREEVG